MNNGKAVVIMMFASMGLSIVGVGSFAFDHQVDVNRILLSLLFALISFVLKVQHKTIEDNMREIRRSLDGIDKTLLSIRERLQDLWDLSSKE